jgi:hypothetical protein
VRNNDAMLAIRRLADAMTSALRRLADAMTSALRR